MADCVIEQQELLEKELSLDVRIVDVANDDDIINLTQRKRLALIDNLAPDGQAPDNPKNNRLYLDALQHTSITAQSRITAKNQVSAVDKDRDVVLGLLREMRNIEKDSPRQVYADASIPTPSKGRFAPNRDVPVSIMDNTVSTETHSEFMKRTEDISIMPPEEETT